MTLKPEYIPQVGDRVSVEGVVLDVHPIGEDGSSGVIIEHEGSGQHMAFRSDRLTFVSRPERPLGVGETVCGIGFIGTGVVIGLDGDEAWVRCNNGGYLSDYAASLTLIGAKP